MNKEFVEKLGDVRRGLFTILYNHVNNFIMNKHSGSHKFIHLRSLIIKGYDVIYEYNDDSGKIHHYTYNFFNDTIRAFNETKS